MPFRKESVPEDPRSSLHISARENLVKNPHSRGDREVNSVLPFIAILVFR